jgi:peptide/nickel transport system substrate-binding protein
LFLFVFTQTDEITLLASEQSREIFSYEYTTNYYEYLLPNLSSTGLGDERVRQAIAHALDRNEIVSNVYVNHAILVDTPVPPTSYLYTGKLLTYDNDVDQAKRLMKLAGWKHTDEDPWLDVDPDGNEMDYTLTLLTNNDNDSPQRYEAATFIKRQLEKIGIKVEIKAEDWDIYKSMVNEGRFDLLLAGRYLSDIPDLRSMLKSDGIRNSSGYKNAEMDDLLIAVMESKTRESIEKNYEKLQQKIVDDVPIISLYFRTHTLLTRNNIVGVTHVTEDNAFASINTWDKR